MKTVNVKELFEKEMYKAIIEVEYFKAKRMLRKMGKMHCESKAQNSDQFYSNEIVRRGNSIFFDIQ